MNKKEVLLNSLAKQVNKTIISAQWKKLQNGSICVLVRFEGERKNYLYKISSPEKQKKR